MSNDPKKKHRKLRRQRSIHGVHYDIEKREEVVTRPFRMPPHREIQAYDRQVAGHTATKDTKFLGLLQCNDGTILKPILKEAQKREVEFYNRLATATEPDLVEMRNFVPRYYGCKKVTYNGHEQEYIILEDLTKNMLEPCIMDVKIGRRTWDPLATEEKIANEKKKYARCKEQFAFCIPGFQVYRLSTGQLHKYDKDYGKKLHGDKVIEAVRSFLNVESGARRAAAALAAALWRLQRWARRARPLRLYAASLLLVYDAARLRPAPPPPPSTGLKEKKYPAAIVRRRSIHSIHSPASAGSNFSGLLTSKGPVYKKVKSVPLSPMTSQASFAPPPPINSPWSNAFDRVNQSHSPDHNYDDKICKMKMNFRATLDQLSTESSDPNAWGIVKIIDFAHVFFNEKDDMGPDENFLEGIDNFVKIFDEILIETQHQDI
ncbi:inositol polyphosphate multikinase [Galleria mellonella]|uniref:Kinase n=1 Tax=Galleria mellonella TaxID=7137 RepID=A0ABM3MIH1_GALME|nr:inositol polyphosphate multikinase [Galleria mellonella]XP_052751193.1 inositol polyphosphate multikinase [Galleria mellonella]XP_052751194.1 inositol polyphosphate multikinase [Galleria mellonella]